MKEIKVKKLYLAFIMLAISACSGYQPLYGELGEEMHEIGLKDVKMDSVDLNVGQRRLAQQLSQKLGRIFTNTENNAYDLYVVLSPNEYAIATRSDYTDKRKSVSVSATMKLVDTQTGKVAFTTALSRNSSYTTQDEPFATESARTKALESVVSSLSGDIIQRAALWFRGYTENENKR